MFVVFMYSLCCTIFTIYTASQVAIEENHEKEDRHEVQLCRLSALHLFRRDYMTQKVQPELSESWFSKEAWGEVREAFGNLPLERREGYEKQRLAHIDRERCLRPITNQTRPSNSGILLIGNGKKPQQATCDAVTLAGEQNQLGTLIPDTKCPAPILANLLPPDFEKMKHATTNIDNCLQETLKHGREYVGAGHTAAWPVEESNVLTALAGVRGKGMTLHDAHRDFSSKCNMVAGPTTGQQEFPNSIMIHGKCGVLCQLEHLPSQRVLHRKIADGLQRTVDFDKPTRVVQDDVLIACKAEYKDRKKMYYMFMTSVSGKGGFHKPDCVQILLKVVSQCCDDDDYATWLQL